MDSGAPVIGNSFLATQIISSDTVTNPVAPLAFGTTAIGSGFAPTGPGQGPLGTASFDVVSSVDGNVSFGAVPEPTSMFVWAGVLAIGLSRSRRRG